MDLLLNNVKDIFSFQQTFLERLKDIDESETNIQYFNEVSQFQDMIYAIGELFLEYCDKFRLYSTYCSCHSRVIKLLENNSSAELKEFLLARNPKQQHTCTLESYLITPIQRILRYPLLMKTTMKYMRTDSDEYTCMSRALLNVEKVADYINEMQRINETFTPIFRDLASKSTFVEHSDLVVDNLIHYGVVHWVNSKNYKIALSRSAENITIFIFKKAVVLLACEPKTNKKNNSPSNSTGNLEVKFRSIITLPSLLLRDHAWSDDDSNQVWEIVDSRNGGEPVVYAFTNSTSEEKKVIVNAIKEALKHYKRNSAISDYKPEPVLTNNNHLLEAPKKSTIRKIPSFNRKKNKDTMKGSSSPRLPMKFSCMPNQAQR